jgi:hypothetical protein
VIIIPGVKQELAGLGGLGKEKTRWAMGISRFVRLDWGILVQHGFGDH